MNRRNIVSENLGLAAWARRVTHVAAILGLGLGLALGVFAAPVPNEPQTAPLPPYSWPSYHAGGVTDPLVYTDPNPFDLTTPDALDTAPFALPPYSQLQGTPSGVVGTGANAHATQIPSSLLGNYVPGQPPTGLTGTAPGPYNLTYSPNHFHDGPLFTQHYYQIQGPLGFNAPATGGGNVVGSPVAVNYTEYNEIASMYYDGEQVEGTNAANAPLAGTPGVAHGTPPGSATVTTGAAAIRQVVYFARNEVVPVVLDPVTGVKSVGGVPLSQMNGGTTLTANIPLGTNLNVGAIYAMDGFTGGIIWRYQTPSFSFGTTALTSSITATLAGPVSSANGNGAQPFEIGPPPTGGGVPGVTAPSPPGPPFTITSANTGGLPFASLNFSLQARTATATSATTASYTGTYQIYNAGGASPGNSQDSPLSTGTFTATATFTNPPGLVATVTAVLTPTTGDTAYGPLNFNGTFSSTAPGVGQTLQGNLNSVAGQTLRDGGLLNSLAVARVKVASPTTAVGGTPTTTQTRLVVFAGDNNGYVYCLDALGNGYWNRDVAAESNTNVVNPATGVVNYDYQDLYSGTGYVQHLVPHVGTTFPYWIYRPDSTQPLKADGTVDAAPGPDHTLPVPQAFRYASPIVYTNATHSIVYLGNSNGVLYALDTVGGQSATGAADVYNVSVTGQPGIDDATPTTTVQWWDALSGTAADTTLSSVSIESAPALYVPTTGNPLAYVGTSDPTGVSAGRVYAVDALVGPTGDNGTGSATPGSPNYNANPKGVWVFPTKNPLGDITGSPVVFTNTDTGTTRVYFGADTGQETRYATNNGTTTTSTFPPSRQTGRLWSVDAATGAFGFVYPSTAAGTGGDPDTSPPTYAAPLEGFLLATPAIGYVQFPSNIQYVDTAGAEQTYTHADSINADVKGQRVPMLYIGSNSSGLTDPLFPSVPSAGGNLYYVDLDGADDTDRNVSIVPAPTGGDLIGSPALTVNTTTAGGNGGSLFFTAGGTLYQYEATPTSTNNTVLGTAVPAQDYQFPFGGPISSPAIAAASVSDINALTGSSNNQSITDWVYVGDSGTGQCFGFTPQGFGNDNTNNFIPDVTPTVPPAFNVLPPLSQFPLRAYLYSSSTAPNSTNLNASIAYGKSNSALPVFEWGQNVYIRIANVVPPGTPDINTPTSYVKTDLTDGSGNTYYLGNGSNVTLNTAEANGSIVDANGSTSSSSSSILPITIPNVFLTAPANPALQNGFFERSDQGTGSANFGNTSEVPTAAPPTGTPATNPLPFANYRAPETVLLDGNGYGIAASAVYSIGFDSALDPLGGNSGRRNTPGDRRDLLGVRQTATLYQLGQGGQLTPASGASTVILSATANANYPYVTAATATTNDDTPPQANVYIDQPTFGILNPLAVRGGGVVVNASNTVASPWVDGNGQDGAGPFRGVNTVPTFEDLAALTNGNNCDTYAPPSGELALTAGTAPPPGPSPPGGVLKPQAVSNALEPYYRYVITTTGQILDGTTGDNSNLVTGDNLISTAYPTDLPKDKNYGPYLLDIADRSMLGAPDGGVASGQPTPQLTIGIQKTNANWQDNTGEGGPGAVINPLPWDTLPHLGQSGGLNSDYPDILANDLTYSYTPQLPGASGTQGMDRTITPQSVQVLLDVPRYQPANLQLWQRPSNGLAGSALSNPAMNLNNGADFPMGYASLVDVVGSTSGSVNVADLTQPYREVYVYTGVPVDIKTHFTNPVTDVGVEPAGYGTQMAQFGTTAIGPFTPYNAYAGYTGHFQPLPIVSDSNVNLINPHLDQKVVTVGGTTNAQSQAPGLPLLADALDSSLVAPYSYIPGYDFTAASDLLAAGADSGVYTLAGTYTAAKLKGNIAPQPYLIRSSFDTDIGEAYGQNPVIATSGSSADFPVATVHKPRVGDGSGVSLTVPDVSHDNNTMYYVPALSPGARLVVNSSGQLVDSTTTKPAYDVPYIGVAIPLGTPAGTYAQNLRLFEGYDTPYNPLLGPTYQGLPGGQSAFDPSKNYLDALQLIYTPQGPYYAAQAYSDPATQIKVTVGEERYTNGFTAGALPMIDLGPANGTANAANFAPFALGLPGPGSLGLYWATSRDYTPGTANTQFRLNAAGLNTSTNGGLTTYIASSSQRWWQPFGSGTSFDLPNQPNGNNVAFSVAQLQSGSGTGYGLDSAGGTLYGFDTNILADGPLSQTTLYCYPLTGGAPTGTGVQIASSPQPKSDQHGLSFTLSSGFTDPNGGAAIGNNLWSFWTGGTRGRTALYYSSANTNGTANLTFANPAVLPVPAGLTAISDPNPVLTNAPDLASTTGAPVPAIEVTYSGTGASGNPDLFLSRYRPYRTTTTPQQILLGLMPFPAQREQLLPDTANLNTNSWWQARDVGWVRNSALAINVNVSVPQGTTGAYQTYAVVLALDPSQTTYTGHYGTYSSPYNIPQSEAVTNTGTTFTGSVVYDRASGILILTNVTLPRANGSSVTFATGQNVYIDVAGGRARFSVPLPYSSPQVNTTYSSYATVAANFNATARRITTGPASDTQPVALLDEAYQPNSSGVPADQNVQADRYWFVWRKTGVTGANPTLWYKTQRLTVALTNLDPTSQTYGQPISLDLTQPLTVQLVNAAGTVTATLYSSANPPAGGNVVDVDPTRGRLYFPITYTSTNGAGTSSSTAMEGQYVIVTGTGKDVNGNKVALPYSAQGNPPQYPVAWQDEPLYNDPNNEAGVGYLEATAADGHQLPLITTINEGGVSAFLDAGAFLNGTGNTPGKSDPGTFNVPTNVVAAPHPHKVWLFWTSNRNGVADIYSETINPRFSAVTDSGSP